MKQRLSFDVNVLLALFSICHFMGRRDAVFGISSIQNSYSYSLAFVSFIVFIAAISPINLKPSRWIEKVAAALLIPYAASVFAYLAVVCLFCIDNFGKKVSFSHVEVLFVALFAPYVASATWVISIYVISWILLDSYGERTRERC